jgi:hypothetical protein
MRRATFGDEGRIHFSRAQCAKYVATPNTRLPIKNGLEQDYMGE